MLKRSHTYRPGLLARLLLAESWRLTLSASIPWALQLGPEPKVELNCLDIVSVTEVKALLWHSVEIRSHGKTTRLSGLTASTAKALAAGIRDFINQYLADLISADVGQLQAVDARLAALTGDGKQYLAHSDLGRAIASIPGRAATALAHPLFDADRLPPKLRLALPKSLEMLTDPAVRHRYNERFVAAELVQFGSFFSNLDGRSLSDQQREACIRLEDNNLLVASAGSGKSTTMVGKVAYVLEKGLVAADEILVLAFNKTAADELKERIAKQLGVDEADLKCRVTTFHALGRAIIEEVEGRPPQLASWVEHPAGEAKVLEGIVQRLIQTDSVFAGQWLDLLVAFPQAMADTEVYDEDEDLRRYREGLKRRGRAKLTTHAGVLVRSMQEQRIANWLWKNSVEFEYERQVNVSSDEAEPQFVHPDFYYPGTDTLHEHFAINADGTSPFESYVEHANAKRLAYQEMSFDFFETTSAEAESGALFRTLERELTKREVRLVLRTDEEIKKAIDPVVLKRYHNLISTCIKHIRASHLTLDMLVERAKSLADKERGRVFAHVVWKVAEAYSAKLEEVGRIDFDSMIADATRLVESDAYTSPYSLILVDEFQDISEPRANLIKALRQQKPFTRLFAVGDDWQSIYRFTGSDVSLFTQFSSHFGESWMGRLEQTYRCNQLIADTAAQFVQRNPAQLKKSVRSVRPAIPKSIRLVPVSRQGKRGRPDFAGACHQILDRLDAFLGSISAQWRSEAKPKLRVMVLWRYNLLDPFDRKPPVYEHIEVSGVSFHRAKGLEADYTVLLDVSEGDYGVPSQIEDDELLHLVVPTPESYPFAEERRLFYVALTRASRGTFLLFSQGEPSPYLNELGQIAGGDVRLEAADGQPLRQCPECLVGHLTQVETPTGELVEKCSLAGRRRHAGPASAARSVK